MTEAQSTDTALGALIHSIPKFHVCVSVDGELIAQFMAFAANPDAALDTAKKFYIGLGHAESVVNGWDWSVTGDIFNCSREAWQISAQ